MFTNAVSNFFTFINKNMPTIAVGILLVLLIFFILYRMHKNKKAGKSSCGCGGCSGCAMNGRCHK